MRLLILIGRTIPGPEAVEAIAGALTGIEPTKVTNGPNGTGWYNRVTRGLRLPDNSGVAVETDQHPDPVAEAVRWQICEAELVQAIGRGRGVNRTAKNPLDLDIVADVCLPVTVDEATTWHTVDPSPATEMLVEGIILTSPVDMVAAWPTVWPNVRAAKRTLKRSYNNCPDVRANAGTRSYIIYYQRLCPHVRKVSYQLAGPKMNRREAFFDPGALPDPRSWLETRLGPLAFFEVGK